LPCSAQRGIVELCGILAGLRLPCIERGNPCLQGCLALR